MAGTGNQRRRDLLLYDPHERIDRFDLHGSPLVGKHCTFPDGLRERQHAAEARQRLQGLTTPATLPVEIVVPEIVEVGSGECTLVTPDLGTPLSMHIDLAVELLPRPTLLTLLQRLFAAGVEAPGFVPRNLFHRDGHLYAIDWEDADFTDASAAPGELTLMKWDIAWSDVYRTDPGIRSAIHSRRSDEPPLDSFERTLLDLTEADLAPAEVRARGIDLTLRSELHVPGVVGPTAAELGHLADELLPAQHSVLHTALTAHLRTLRGDQAYAEVLTALWDAVRDNISGDNRRTDQLRSEWLRTLFVTADACLTSSRRGGSLAETHHELSALATRCGWAAARRRAELAETLLVRVCDLVVSALDLTELELILRGSLAQGLVTRSSDLDFELSGPGHPNGHRGAERLILDILTAFGIQAEASAGRPTEADLHDLRSGRLTRDLHEWMELRRPGSELHDPGWLWQFFAPTVAELVNTDSEYERTGQQRSAKYAWFEARALLARLAFRHATKSPPATVPQQLDLLPGAIGESATKELRGIVRTALDLREHDPDPASLCALQRRIADFRRRAALAGPAPR